MQDKILVSCTVLAYNSSATIIETLESIKAQTYTNIELIISDDCSTDNTIAVCQEWLNENRDRFVRTEILTTDHNTGVVQNSQRVLNACRGEWRKGVGADDVLLPNCVEDFVHYVENHPEAKWVSSRYRVYNQSFEEKNLIISNASAPTSLFEKDAIGQIKETVVTNVFAALALFYNIRFIKNIGYDSTYMFEDYPMIINILERGERCYFLDKETVCYRVQESISHSMDRIFKYNTMLGYRKFKEERIFKYMTSNQKKYHRLLWKLQDFFEKHHLNNSNKWNHFLYYKIYALLQFLYLR